jgi:hypothetical protein
MCSKLINLFVLSCFQLSHTVVFLYWLLNFQKMSSWWRNFNEETGGHLFSRFGTHFKPWTHSIGLYSTTTCTSWSDPHISPTHPTKPNPSFNLSVIHSEKRNDHPLKHISNITSFHHSINYLSRVGTRVLWPISEFSCKNALELYQNVKRMKWTRYIPNNKTFRVGTKSLFVWWWWSFITAMQNEAWLFKYYTP